MKYLDIIMGNTAVGEVITLGRSSYKVTSLLGEGGFAFVFAVEEVGSGKSFALKRLLASDEESRALAEQEVHVMVSLSSYRGEPV
jgi:cyclin G-associated kinase